MTELERYTEGDLDDGMATHARLVLIEVPERETYPEPLGWRLSVSLIFSPRNNTTVSKS